MSTIYKGFLVFLAAMAVAAILFSQSQVNGHGGASTAKLGGIAVTSQIGLTKAASPISFSTVGTTITYTYTVKNIGTPTLAGPFSVNDSALGSFSCGSGPLTTNQTTTCTKTISTTQTNIDNGTISNTASVSGNGAVSTITPPVVVTAVQNPLISMSKSPSPTTYTAIGNIINYTYHITNTGNVTLAGPFTVVDNNFGTLTNSNCSSGTLNGPLAPAASINCIFAYSVTNQDILNQAINNTAHAQVTYQSMVVQSVPVVAQATCTGCGGATTWSVTNTAINGYNDTHGPYSNVCAGPASQDDAPPIQNTLNYAANQYNMTGQFQTVTIPSGAFCQMNSFPNQASGGGPNWCFYIQARSGVTLTTTGTAKANMESNVTNTANCGGVTPAHYIIGFCGAGPQGIPDCSATWFDNFYNSISYYPLNTTTAGSNTITLTNVADASHFAVGDFFNTLVDLPNFNPCTDICCSGAGAGATDCTEWANWITSCAGSSVVGTPCTGNATLTTHDPMPFQYAAPQAVIGQVSCKTIQSCPNHDATVNNLSFDDIGQNDLPGFMGLSDNFRSVASNLSFNNFHNIGSTYLWNCNEVYNTTFTNINVNWTDSLDLETFTEFCQRSSSNIKSTNFNWTRGATNFNTELGSAEWPSYQTWDSSTLNVCQGVDGKRYSDGQGCYLLNGSFSGFTNSTLIGTNLFEYAVIGDRQAACPMAYSNASGCQPYTYINNTISGSWSTNYNNAQFTPSVLSMFHGGPTPAGYGYTVQNNHIHLLPGAGGIYGIAVGGGGNYVDNYTVTGNTNGGNPGDQAAPFLAGGSGGSITCTVSNNSGFSSYSIASGCTQSNNTWLMPLKNKLFELAGLLMAFMGAFVLIQRKGRI